MNSGNTKLKICGIRSLEEAEELQNLEIDYLGCIFHFFAPHFCKLNSLLPFRAVFQVTLRPEGVRPPQASSAASFALSKF